jgi:transcriptional regulator with XRE-family HTH domain
MAASSEIRKKPKGRKGKGGAASLASNAWNDPPAPESPLIDIPLEKKLGAALKRHRIRNKLTLAELAEGAGISVPMLSRIENGVATASFDTLARISKAVGVNLSSLFRELEAVQGRAQLIKVDQQMEVVRTGTKMGHVYNLLAYSQGPRKEFEPFLITMLKGSEAYPRFRHPGTEFIYMLEGRLEYRHGDQTYLLEPGDAFTFSGEVEHGPERMMDDLIRFLDIIIYPDTTG